MPFQTASAPTQPHLSMSTNTNARNPSTSSPVKTYHKTPGSNGIPMSSVLLQKGITHKTASTARKSASIGNADSPLFSAKAASALRRPSEDHSSDSTSTSRGKNTSLTSASLSTTKSAQAAKKRKRVPFYYSEDDMVRSDLISTRPGKISGSTLGSGTVANFNSSPAASHSPDAVTTVANSTPPATDPKIPRTISGPTIVDLDPPDATSAPSGLSNVSGIPKESNDRLRPMKKKQRTVQSTLSFSRPSIFPSEVITIESDDDELSPAAASQTPTPVALVEAAGEAAIIPSGEVRSSTHSAPRPSSFTQRVRNIKERLSHGSEAAKTLHSSPILAPDRSLSRIGTTPDAKALPGRAISAPESDAEAATGRATGDTVECPIPVKEAPRIEEQPQEEAVEQLSVENETILPVQLVPPISTPMPTQGFTIPEDKETVNVVDKIPDSLEHSQADAVMQDSDMQDVSVSAEEVENLDSASLQITTAEQAVLRGATTESQSLLEEGVDNRQAEDGERLTDDSSKTDSASSQDSVDKTPSQSHQSVMPVELDRNMPGVRGRVVREYMDLEDKYARIFRAQAWLHPPDRTYVNHDFFNKCINPLSIPREELECMVHKLENTIFILYEEASQYIISQQFYRITPGVLLRGRIDDYFLSDRLTLSLDERLQKLLREITVMTFSHSKIMFQAWVAAGQQPLEGKIVLSTESILELVENHKKISSEIEQDDKIAGANGKDGYNIGHDPVIDVDAQRNNPGLDSREDHTRDVEMTDAVGEAVDNLNRRNSLIVKLSAPPTILRELDRSKASLATAAAAAQAHCALAPVAPSAVPSTDFTFSIPPPAAQTLDPPRPSKPNARAKSSKSKESGVAHITSIVEQMNHFGSSRMDQINVTTKERHDPYLKRIRQLDQEKEKVRLELRQLTEESTRKTAEYDKQLTLLLHEADFLDQESKLNGLGPNGYLPPERDLKWDLYERLHREKADHETDTAAAKEKLIRRGHSINEEKRRAHVFYKENLAFEQSIEARKKEFEQSLLMNPYHGLGLSSYASSSNSTPSTREPSAAVGAVADRPATEGVPVDSSESSGPSSIFSEEAVSTPATVAPDRPIVNKAAAFQSMRSLFENNINGGFGSGYGNMLLIGIRDAAMLEVGEAPPASRTASQLLAADVARKKKKRPVKGW